MHLAISPLPTIRSDINIQVGQLVLCAADIRGSARPLIIPRIIHKPSTDRIALDVASTSDKILTNLNRLAFETPLPENTGRPVPLVVMLHIRLLNARNEWPQVVKDDFSQHVIVRIHPHPVIHRGSTRILVVLHQISEVPPICIILEYRTSVNPAIHQMITHRPLKYTRCPWHEKNTT